MKTFLIHNCGYTMLNSNDPNEPVKPVIWVVRSVIFRKHRIVSRIKKNNLDILTVFEGHRLMRIDEIEL